MNYRYAMFPGSFDPVTNGHIDIVRRLSSLYDKVFIVVALNRRKSSLFTLEERKSFFENAVKNFKNVEVVTWDGLLVDCAKFYDTGVVIRGVRNINDYIYELEVSELNKSLCPELEVFFMISNAPYALISSSNVKELASFGADVKDLVPKEVSKALINKFKG